MTKTMPNPSAVPMIEPTPIESTLTLLSDKVVKQLLIMLNRNKAVQMIITHLRNLYIIYTSLSLSFPTTFIVFIRYFLLISCCSVSFLILSSQLYSLRQSAKIFLLPILFSWST